MNKTKKTSNCEVIITKNRPKAFSLTLPDYWSPLCTFSLSLEIDQFGVSALQRLTV